MSSCHTILPNQTIETTLHPQHMGGAAAVQQGFFFFLQFFSFFFSHKLFLKNFFRDVKAAELRKPNSCLVEESGRL